MIHLFFHDIPLINNILRMFRLVLETFRNGPMGCLCRKVPQMGDMVLAHVKGQ